MARALLKTPSPRFASGLTSQSSGAPDLELALAQHRSYQQALEQLGYEVLLLPADDLADSCFVEDMAVVAGPLVIAGRSPVRAAEQGPVVAALAEAFRELGYDVLMVDPEDWHAANVLAVDSQVLLPAGHPRVVENLVRLGFTALEVDLSEYKKQDGGASCLSILWP